MELEHVLARLARIEDENRRLMELHRKRRWRAGAAWVVVLSLGLMGAMRSPETPKVIEAKSFVARGDDGKVRATFGIDDEGVCGFELTEADGTKRLRATLNPDHTVALALYSQEEEPSIGILTKPEGYSALGMGAPDGKSQFTVGNAPKGQVLLNMLGPDDKTRVGLGVYPDGQASLNLLGTPDKWLTLTAHPSGAGTIRFMNGQDTEPRISIEMADDGRSRLGLLGADGTRRIVLGGSADGEVGLALGNGKDRPHSGIFTSRDNPSRLILGDSQGLPRMEFGVDAQAKPYQSVFEIPVEIQRLPVGK